MRVGIVDAMNTTTTTAQEQALQAFISNRESASEFAFDRAIASIAKAREELDFIETNLNLARTGEAHHRIGEVRGASAQAIFDAFGAFETLAHLRGIALR
jgi:hypothetical protein